MTLKYCLVNKVVEDATVGDLTKIVYQVLGKGFKTIWAVYLTIVLFVRYLEKVV